MPDPNKLFSMALDSWVLERLMAQPDLSEQDQEFLARQALALRERAEMEQINPAGGNFDTGPGSPLAEIGPDGVIQIADQTRPSPEVRQQLTRRFVEDMLAQQLQQRQKFSGTEGVDYRTGEPMFDPAERMGEIAGPEGELGGPANLDLMYLAKLMAVMKNTGKGRLGTSPKSAIDLETGEGGRAEPSVLEASAAVEEPFRNFWTRGVYDSARKGSR